MLRRQLLTAALTSGLGPAMASDNPEMQIHWYDYDLPPISIVSGPQRNEGINNLMRKRLIAGLSAYDHQVRVANFARIAEAMRSGETAACVGFQKTPEREQWMQYSVPFTIAMPYCAIVLESHAPSMRTRLDTEGRFLLDQALVNTKVGVAGGRSYGESINQILERHAIGGNVVTRNANDVSAGLLDMLKARRFDATIMFPEEAQYLARQLGDKIRLLSYPIKETPASATVHVVAPRTPWGSKLLEQINPLLLKARDSADFHRERTAWLDDEARKRYKPMVTAMLRSAS